MFLENEKKEIEAEFMASWDHIEAVWKRELHRVPHPLMAEILVFIWTLRECGYDRQLRVYQTIGGSLENGWVIFGLRRLAYHDYDYEWHNDQPQIEFILFDYSRFGIRLIAPEVNFRLLVKYLEFNSDIERLLSLLLAHPMY